MELFFFRLTPTNSMLQRLKRKFPLIIVDIKDSLSSAHKKITGGINIDTDVHHIPKDF